MSFNKRTSCIYCGTDMWLTAEKLPNYDGGDLLKYRCGHYFCLEEWLETSDGKVYPLRKRIDEQHKQIPASEA